MNQTFKFSRVTLILFNKHWENKEVKYILEDYPGEDPEGESIQQYKLWLSLSSEQKKYVEDGVYGKGKVVINLSIS
jgi:hypothetical protein